MKSYKSSSKQHQVRIILSFSNCNHLSSLIFQLLLRKHDSEQVRTRKRKKISAMQVACLLVSTDKTAFQDNDSQESVVATFLSKNHNPFVGFADAVVC